MMPAYFGQSSGSPQLRKMKGRRRLSGCRLIHASILLVLGEGTAMAQEVGPPREQDVREPYQRLFPIGAQAAIDRGYDVQLPFGVGFLRVANQQKLEASELEVALSKDADTGDPAVLRPVPFVVPQGVESEASGPQLKLDLWVFPFLNLFASAGRLEGNVDVAVDIDLDAVFPFPICRPANPCGTRRLDFAVDTENTTTTFGALAVYGGRGWFVAGSAAKTISVSSKERSNVESLNAALRVGPRIKVGTRSQLALYSGFNYFDLDHTITGTVIAPDIFEDGGDLVLDYRTRLRNRKKYQAVLGADLSLGRHWHLQGEYDRGGSGHRSVLSVTYRF